MITYCKNPTVKPAGCYSYEHCTLSCECAHVLQGGMHRNRQVCNIPTKARSRQIRNISTKGCSTVTNKACSNKRLSTDFQKLVGWVWKKTLGCCVTTCTKDKLMMSHRIGDHRICLQLVSNQLCSDCGRRPKGPGSSNSQLHIFHILMGY